MELNGVANIDMILQSKELGHMTAEEALEQIKEQNDFLLKYLRHVAEEVHKKDVKLKKWHEVKND